MIQVLVTLIATEAFFELPERYEALRSYYRQDPAADA